MKRLCTKQEREVLYKNRGQIIKGMVAPTANERWSDLFILIFGTIFLAGGMLVGLYYFLAVTDQFWILPDGKCRPEVIICLFIAFWVIEKIMSLIERNREAREFKKRNDIRINGATIVEINPSGHFSYMEDDFYDETGRPVILDDLFSNGEVRLEEVGKRILVMYVGESDFRLVKLNEELSGLIPDATADYPLKEDLYSYMRVPHPNMVNIEKTEHDLSESEKTCFADFYVKAVRKDYAKMQKVAAIGMMICIVILSVLFGSAEKGYPVLEKCVMYGAAGLAGLVVFFGLLTIINKKLTRKRAKFVSVKKVVLVDQGVRNKRYVTRVFEWEQEQAKLCEYEDANCIPRNIANGSILYKLVNPKGKMTFLDGKQVKQRSYE